MLTRLMTLVAVFAIFGCASSQVDRKSAPVDTSIAAITIFRAQWEKQVNPKLTNAQRTHYGVRIKNVQPSATRIPFNQALKLVDSTLTEKERKTLVLHGSLADLKRTDNCWAVKFRGNRGGDIVGYVASETGDLVFVWFAPEG